MVPFNKVGRCLAGMVLAVVVGSAHAASPDPSLGAFRILDQISPANRREIVRSVQNSVSEPVPLAGVTPIRKGTKAGLAVLAAGDEVLFHYEARYPGAWLPRHALFVLNRSGRLRLPDGTRVVLAGLTEQEAAWRLESERVFHGLRIIVRILPSPPMLHPFGDSLFSEGDRSPFAHLGRRLPAHYRLVPGDELAVSWSGPNPGHVLARVGHDGAIVVPGVGSLAVAGHRFVRARARVIARLQAVYPKDRVTMALIRLHRIRVFVLGDVRRPGAYVLSPFSRVTDALFASGGPTLAGSVRAIVLKRHGQPVGSFDLYALVLGGDTAEDRKLHSDEVVFVPPLGPTVAIQGAVARPALYELTGPETLKKLIALAGGLRPDADRTRIMIERFVGNNGRVLLSANLSQPAGRHLLLADGDRIRVPRVSPVLHRAVELAGDVERPRSYPWTDGMRLTDLIPARADLGPSADPRYILILRRRAAGGSHFVAADWLRARRAPHGPKDPHLLPGDQVYVFPLSGSRAPQIMRLVQQAAVLSGITHYVPMVEVGGRVRDPGVYPFTPDMTVPGLLAAAGGLVSDPARLEVTVSPPNGAGPTVAALMTLIGPSAPAAARLQAGDTVRIATPPETEGRAVVIRGAVRHPGHYPMAPSATVSDLIRAAGGALPGADLAVLSLSDPQLARARAAAVARLVAVLKTVAPRPGMAGAEARVALGLLSAPLTGRVQPDHVTAASRRLAWPLVDGDRVTISATPGTMAIAGFVLHPRVFVYQPDIAPRDLIVLAGGLRAGADPGHLLIRRASGRLVPVRTSWFHRIRLRPGDVLVVPPRLDRLPGPDRGPLRALIALALAP